MAILSVQISQAGLSGTLPGWAYILTNDILADVTASGYLNVLAEQGYNFVPQQCALVYTTDYHAVTMQISINNGVYTLTYNGGGGSGVTSVRGTAGQISSSGGSSPIIGLINSGVTPGAYTTANISVDAYGRVTAATSGSGGSGTVTSVTGGFGISSSGGTTPQISVSASYPGQATIVSVGALSSGSLATGFTPVTGELGGTGVAKTGKTITLGGNFATTVANAIFRMTATTDVTFPTTGTLATVAGTIGTITAGTGINVSAGTNPTISLANTAVAPASYTYASITVDQQGRLTAASSGTAPVTTVVGTGNQITVTGSTAPILSFPNTVIFPGTVTLNGDPTAPLQAATKQYVDLIGSGFTFKGACIAATTANLTATYANGASGVGATLTNSGTQAAFATDGISPALNDRVLVKNQTTQAQNGIYTLTTIGSGATNWVLTRATDYDSNTEIAPGNFVIVASGTLYSQTGWIQIDTVTTVGTSPVVFNQFGGVTSGVTSVSGQTNFIDVTSPTTTPVITISPNYAGQASIVTVGTVGTGTWNGTVITGQYGGTGVANTGKTITLGGNLTTSGAFASTFTMTGATAVTFPTSGTLATTAGTVASVTTGNAAHITIGGSSTNPTVDIASGYTGQTSITTVGALTAGSLATGFTPVTGELGGTGVANTGKTITLGGSLTTSGAFTATFTMTANTAVTFPTSGTLLTSSALTNYALLNATNSFGFNQQYQMQVNDYSETVNALGSVGGGTLTINLTLGNVVSATATANVTTVTVSNVPASGTCSSFSLLATNFGAFTITWPASFKWASAIVPTLTASGVDVLVFFTVNGGTTWYGNVAGQGYA